MESSEQFFDTHTHFEALLQRSGNSLSEALQLAQKSGVQKILMAAIKQENFAQVAELAHQAMQQLCYGVGLHPLFLTEHQLQDLNVIESYLIKNDKQLVALAEIGLERAVPELLTDENWQKQCELFSAQLSLAKKFNLPVSMHARRSNDQIVPFLRQANLSKCGVVHGFSGSYQQAKRLVDLGYYIGVGGTITYERANKTRKCIKRLPLDALVLETDTPDMPLAGFQGQPNRPERVVQVFNELCTLREELPQQIAETIWQTSSTLFNF